WQARVWLADPVRETLAGGTVDEALLAHTVYTPEVRHPVEVPASQQQHLVTWLSKRLDAEIRAPALEMLGFELLGGRLLSAAGGPAAQFMYQDGGGRRLTLFVRRTAGSDTAFRYLQRDGLNAFYWTDRDLGYALIGDLDKAALTQVAHAVYNQLGF
ncbi:MAG: anti-sigma factor, partial [Candidatus Competibacterales bacterium]|nr:anti-sigma factor [Candidatus Competibacterales bacterium]